MKRYINGVRMLNDLALGKISSFEKLLYLCFVFFPLENLFDVLFRFTSTSPVSPQAESFGYILILIGMLVFLITNYKIDDKSLIERYCCLFIPAMITSYLFLIPFLIIAEKILGKSFGFNLEDMSDYFITGYVSIYICMSLITWKKLKFKSNKTVSI